MSAALASAFDGNAPTTAVAPANSSNAAHSGRCDNADCNANKLIAMVPKRKTTQFVTEPSVLEKPMLINGFTTIFQVDGTSAKLADLKQPNTNSNAPNQSKNIFRIVPNRHSHIVNYVVIDADGESLRKINESDPATMRKLLESQKVSADQMLQKLMTGHGTQLPAGNAPSNNAARNAVPSPALSAAASAASVPSAAVTAAPVLPLAAGNSSAKSSTSSAIQLPLRMHPNLKITAVSSTDPSAIVAPAPPLITPVPLANLQAASSSSSSSNSNSNINAASMLTPNAASTLRSNNAGIVSSTAAATTGVVDAMEKPSFDKMQAELQELRRTVAMLAEAQAKNTNANGNRAAKRPRQA